MILTVHRFIELLFDTQLFHAVTQRPESDAEELGGIRAVVARLFERFDNRFLLDALQILGQRQRRAKSREVLAADDACGLPLTELQVLNADLVARGESERPLEDIFEFPDIAGKRV